MTRPRHAPEEGPRRDLKPFLISTEVTVVQAMHRLEETAEKILFVTEEDGRLVGSLSDGDIRRWILGGGELHAPVMRAANPHARTVGPGYRRAAVKALLLEGGLGAIPVLDASGGVRDLLFSKDLFRREAPPALKQTHLPVVIMAGGMGTRLDPFTRILPKPLIPINDKPVIEIIIDRFRRSGVSRFLISVHHKAKVIKSYFEDLMPPYAVEYLEEGQPLGTAGGLALLKGRVDTSFIVANCDIIVDADFGKIAAHHEASGNALTLVASPNRHVVPYGVCQVDEEGCLASLEEKPEYHFLVNIGLYFLRPEVLDLIPPGGFLHMTGLIALVREKGWKVGVYPVPESAWVDTGEWDVYKRAVALFPS